MWTKLLGHIITIASDSGLLSVAFLLSSRNSQNKVHANIKRFTVNLWGKFKVIAQGYHTFLR